MASSKPRVTRTAVPGRDYASISRRALENDLGATVAADYASLYGGLTVTPAPTGTPGPPGPAGGTVNSIDGLELTWLSASTIAVSAGGCYVDSAAASITFSTTSSPLSAGGTANVFYYVYVPATGPIYTSTSIPSISATGRLVGGSGTTDRCIGAVYTDSGGNVINFTHQRAGDMYWINAQTDNAPWILSVSLSSNVLVTLPCVTPVGTKAVSIECQMTTASSFSLPFTVYFGNSAFTPTASAGIVRTVCSGVSGLVISYHFTIALPDGSTLLAWSNSVPFPVGGFASVYQLGWTGPGA